MRKPRGLIAGTPTMIADVLEDWFTSGACDGFVLPWAVFPGTYEDFARMVTPELQRRGLLRTEYAGRTLRENIQNPASVLDPSLLESVYSECLSEDLAEAGIPFQREAAVPANYTITLFRPAK